MHVRVDDLQGAAIADLLQEHLSAMYRHSPRESVHALDLEALRRPEITFWTAWESGTLLGCGALKQLNFDHAELKSMRTATAHLRKGVVRAIVRHIEQAAKAKGVQRLSLETGSHAPFAAAKKLYESEGFVECGPFAGYARDPHSLFMTKVLA